MSIPTRNRLQAKSVSSEPNLLKDGASTLATSHRFSHAQGSAMTAPQHQLPGSPLVPSVAPHPPHRLPPAATGPCQYFKDAGWWSPKSEKEEVKPTDSPALKRMLQQRAKLPAANSKDEFLQLVSKNQVFVVPD